MTSPLRATIHFEHCIGSASQAVALLENLISVANARETSDPPASNGRERRLKQIWNRAKHFDEDIMPPRMAPENITAPVWLTNTGISSQKATVTWMELYNALAEQQRTLKFLGEDLPHKVVELRKRAEQAKADEEQYPGRHFRKVNFGLGRVTIHSHAVSRSCSFRVVSGIARWLSRSRTWSIHLLRLMPAAAAATT